MPAEFVVRDDGGIVVTGFGAASGKDIIRINAQIYESPEKIRAIKYQLCDLTRVEDIDIQADEVRKLADQDKLAASHNPGMKIAIVCGRELAYGLARMWEGYVGGQLIDTKVFRSMEEAEAWVHAAEGSH